jgi:cytochrome b6
MFTTLKIVPAHVLFLEGEMLAIFGFMIGGLIWLLVPYLDRRAGKEMKSPGFTLFGLIILLYIIIMTALTYLHPSL